jgi:hypothetical protein
MEDKKHTKNNAVERRVQAHPSPKYFNLFTGYMKVNEFRKCEAANEIIKEYFDSMSEDKRIKYMNEGIKNKNHY